MLEFKEYVRTNIAEMAEWIPGTNMTGISISDEDKKAGSPLEGDMIARNPKNHADKWLVAKVYYKDNFAPAPLKSGGPVYHIGNTAVGAMKKP